jgi:hypothetical protein
MSAGVSGEYAFYQQQQQQQQQQYLAHTTLQHAYGYPAVYDPMHQQQQGASYAAYLSSTDGAMLSAATYGVIEREEDEDTNDVTNDGENENESGEQATSKTRALDFSATTFQPPSATDAIANNDVSGISVTSFNDN